MAIYIPGAPRRICLETAKRHAIPNDQEAAIFPEDRIALGHLQTAHGNSVTVRTDVCARYNCHGMTFADRRTWITDTAAIMMILADDDLREVERKDVLPGDIVLYFAPDGDVEHSAIVIESPSAESYDMPKVYSKWGKWKEVIHYAHISPYNPSNLKFYRLKV